MNQFDELVQTVSGEFSQDGALAKAAPLFASAGRARDYDAIVHGRAALRWLHCFASLGRAGQTRAGTDEIVAGLESIAQALEQTAAPELAATDIRRGMGAAARVVDLLSSTPEDARRNATFDMVLDWIDEIAILAAALEQIEARRRMAARAIASEPGPAAH